MNTKYSFKYRGSLSGHAFTLVGLDGLMEKVEQIEARSGISAGANGIERHHTADRPADEETAVSAADWQGEGWYVTYFDGHADWFSDQIDALVSYIEERTETRLA
jgi:hypothetical protein